MHDTAYQVIIFREQEGGLVAAAPISANSMTAAVGEAQRLAQDAAGALVTRHVASSRGDDETIEIIFRTGDVPDSPTACT
jgi:hypothetical protein